MRDHTPRGVQVVWFKRDLRTHDHPALTLAYQRHQENPHSQGIVPLYIVEPELWRQSDMSTRHYDFLAQCIGDLQQQLAALGLQLIVRVGEAVSVLRELSKTHTIDSLFSHQETWNGWTFKRDLSVKAWSEKYAIRWHEPLQHGVFRRLKSRDGWAALWYQYMKQPQLNAPDKMPMCTDIDTQPWPTANELGLQADPCPQRQPGGRTYGLACLHSFLHQRGEHYTKAMSSPLAGFDACSRLSPHIAFGTLSLREIVHACEQRSAEIKTLPEPVRGRWPSAMRSFSGRLRWHCHFIQKLEDAPWIEHDNLHPAYDGLRLNDNLEHLEAWKTGHTGYPMIDACMRSLIATGWLNFRMRAMLMSFASHHLWLHWRETSLHLARLFTDYEPGIHYAQAQMQSGTTGINSIRIYNPIKQGMDQDPDGTFIRTWIPELADMPSQYIHTPWQCATHMNDYPTPIIDEAFARKRAADALYGLRKQPTHKDAAQGIVEKHASRKRRAKPKSTRKSAQKANPAQGELPL